MAFPLLSEGFRNSLFFGIYGKILGPEDRDSRQGYAAVFVAAGVAGGAHCLAATPIELIKVNLQSQNGLFNFLGKIKLIDSSKFCEQIIVVAITVRKLGPRDEIECSWRRFNRAISLIIGICFLKCVILLTHSNILMDIEIISRHTGTLDVNHIRRLGLLGYS